MSATDNAGVSHAAGCNAEGDWRRAGDTEQRICGSCHRVVEVRAAAPSSCKAGDAEPSDLDVLATWIAARVKLSEHCDHACAQCIPDGAMVQEGFQCAVHLAHAIATGARQPAAADARPIYAIAQDVHACATAWEPGAMLMGNVRADEVALLAEYAMRAHLDRAALVRGSGIAPQAALNAVASRIVAAALKGGSAT